MNLNTQTFDQLVASQVAAIQSRAAAMIDFVIGSVLRSIVESNSTVALWFQGLLLQILVTTRAATSSGTDLDSWAADYSFTRLPATYTTGTVTFSRFSTGLAALIPVGTQIQTSDASPEIFAVIADATNPAYSATLGAYSVPIGTGSVSVLVQCTTSGSSGNILAGQCNTLTGSIPGIDTVTNANSFTNGLDAETDTAFRARFVSYLGSLSKATKNAILNAVASVQQGIGYTLTENYSTGGALQPGFFYVVADDGTGNLPSILQTAINNAVDAVRPFTSTFTVIAPNVQAANVVMTITSATHATDAALVIAAIQAYIPTLGIGGTLPWSKLAQIAYDASPTITNVTGVTLNGGTADIAGNPKQRITVGTITVN